LNKASHWVKNKLQKYLPDQERMRIALSFGIDMALYTTVSTVGLLLISLIMNSLISGIIIIAICYFNQTIGGGYHANTHLKCFLSMSLFLILGILFCKLNLPNFILCIIGLTSGIVLLVYPVVLHPNRAFLKNKLPYFIRRARYIVSLEIIIVAIFTAIQFYYSKAYTIALTLSAISRIAAKATHHIEE